jgi:DNA-binding IscR family transcriptional regulator
MGLDDDCILGNGALHDRFRLATEILGALVSNAPRPLSMAQLEDHTGRPAKELVKLCGSLWGALLMRPDASIRDGWVLAGPPNAITLEDIFRCVLESQPGRSKVIAAKPDNPDRTHHDVDLLVMQATMAINQSVFQHLRQFSLDRLKASASSMSAFSRHVQRRSRYDAIPDFA